VAGVPILIDESESIFSISDFLQHRPTYFQQESKSRRVAKDVLPSISNNPRAKQNYATFLANLPRRVERRARVLIVGGGIAGEGSHELLTNPEIELVESDVSLAPRTTLVCDAHSVPFPDGYFDGVVAQAVLEHVLDPQRCVAEFHRVLAPDGLVYAETPFCLQVHGRQYDFTRYTRLGHRRLFRGFAEIGAGPCGGPGMALAWCCQYFLLSWLKSSWARNAARVFSRLGLFWLKYLDLILMDEPGALDAASGFYFLGRKSATVLSDRDLLRLYRGGE
jgi:SAM-dependent methyltransferase